MREERPIPTVSLSRLREAEAEMTIDRKSTYHKVYRDFLRFFRDSGRITEHVFIVGANMAYGWMPTILDLYDKDVSVDDVAALLERVKGGERLSREDLDKVKRAVNNSVVGASKLLHFINPNSYAIWDSRVCTFINASWDHRHRRARVNEVSDYVSYLANCEELVRQEGFEAIHRAVNANIGYDVSVYRAVEQIMYEGGKARP